MEKIALRGRNPIKGDGNLWTVILQQIIIIAVGIVLYFILSLLGYLLFQVGIGNVIFRPATAILSLFGLLYGPWVGLFVGILGKTFSDVAAGWGFYWNGSLSYGLIGLIPGFVKIAIKDLGTFKNILSAVLASGLGVLAGALFFAITGAYGSGVSPKLAALNFFWPEFAGNFIGVIIFLPLLLLAVAPFDRKRIK